MVIVVVVAHCPAVGVKVKVVVAVLFNAGAQVPVKPLVEVVGSGAMAAPEQIGPTGLKVGVIFGFTVITIAVDVALADVKQPPPVTVMVQVTLLPLARVVVV